MTFEETLIILADIFSGGLSGAVSNIILLTTLVIVAFKIRGFFRKRAMKNSQKQAHDDRIQLASDNQSRDKAQHESEMSLAEWRERIRNDTDSKS